MILEVGDIVNLLPNGGDCWVRVEEGHQEFNCRGANDPVANMCIFKGIGCCKCSPQYRKIVGECRRSPETRPFRVFIKTVAPVKAQNIGTFKCKKIPNCVTTVGKNYVLESIETSEFLRYKDDLKEYSYILKDEYSMYFSAI